MTKASAFQLIPAREPKLKRSVQRTEKHQRRLDCITGSQYQPRINLLCSTRRGEEVSGRKTPGRSN